MDAASQHRGQAPQPGNGRAGTAPSTTVLSMVDIEKSFPGVRALAGANLEIRAGEIHGLVGENGAGKSTIIKVLAGVYTPDAGRVEIGGAEIPHLTPQTVHDRGLRFIHQELHLVPYFTVAESVFMGHELQGGLGLRGREMRRRTAEILEHQLGLQLDPGALIRDISPAQKKLVQVARALTDEDVRLIVFDEPTAPLAATEVEQVLTAVRRLRDQGVASLYVSHYLGEITDICDRVTVFRNGGDVGRIEIGAEGAAGAAGADGTAADGATAQPDPTREMIRLMTGKEAGRLFPELPEPGERELFSATGLGDGQHFGGIDLRIREGEILGIAGLLGSGTEELVDALVGLRRTRGGTIAVEERVVRFSSPADALRRGVVLIPRDRRHDGLVLDLPVQDNISLSTLDDACGAGPLLSGKKISARAERMIGELDVRPTDAERKVRLLSGGNQQKVVIARALLTEAKVIILDEPTVGVDIGAKAEIYRLIAELAAQGAAVLVSSNDPTELLGLCHRIEVMVRGRIARTADASDLDRDSLVEAMTASGPISEGAAA